MWPDDETPKLAAWINFSAATGERNVSFVCESELASIPLWPEPNKITPAVGHDVIAGALFDFMGWLTSRKERLVLSSADNASPAVEAIIEFAKMRGLSMDSVRVKDWVCISTTAERKPLTDEQIDDLKLPESGKGTIRDLVRIIEAAHGIGGVK